jgi:hypothetical protein
MYYRGFYCGRTELEYEKSEYREGFTFKYITAKRDRNRKMWYGIVRAMKDPQRWANKWLSQILHIINTNAKGGAFVETNALKDPRKAEEQWSASSPLIELNEGGINKVKERTPAQTPNGLDKLMSFAFESLPMSPASILRRLGLVVSRLARPRRSARNPPTDSRAAIRFAAPVSEASREDAAVLHLGPTSLWAPDSDRRKEWQSAVHPSSQAGRHGGIRPSSSIRAQTRLTSARKPGRR